MPASSLSMSGRSTGVLTLRPYPAPLPPYLYPPYPYLASLPAPTPIYVCEKAPGSSPIWVGKPGAFIDYPLRRCPLMLRQLLCLGRFVAGEHRCGCGQFGAGHEFGAEGCELACVAFGYAEQGQQLGGCVGHDGL